MSCTQASSEHGPLLGTGRHLDQNALAAVRSSVTVEQHQVSAGHQDGLTLLGALTGVWERPPILWIRADREVDFISLYDPQLVSASRSSHTVKHYGPIRGHIHDSRPDSRYQIAPIRDWPLAILALKASGSAAICTSWGNLSND